jgi:tungstate transport system permease protein
VGYIWDQVRAAVPLIWQGNSYIWAVTWVTIRVAVISTACALVIGLPLGVGLGLGRFRGRRALQLIANASLALPPVLVGVFVLLLLLPQSILGGLQIEFTLRGVYVVQTLLSIPYIVALTPAAIRGLPDGLLDQARAFGAGRVALARLALREARIGVLAAVIAALASTLSEVAAVIIVGGNIENHDQTLTSAIVSQVNDYDNIPYALAIAIVLLALILVLMGVLTVMQQRGRGLSLHFRARPA